MKEIILAKYGEIILKGGNRPKFENILMNNIRNSLKNVPGNRTDLPHLVTSQKRHDTRLLFQNAF